MNKAKRKENLDLAKTVKKNQREKSPNYSSNSLDLILDVKRYRDADWTAKMIAEQTGRAISTINKITSDLDAVQLTSPTMKQLAVEAATDILQSQDNTNRVKVIDKIFPDEKVSKSSPSVNINIKPFDKDFANKDYEYTDVEGY